METALWMIFSLMREKPLSSLLGGCRRKIAVGESVGIKESIREVLKEIDLRLSQGLQRIKIKIKPGWDIKLLDAVRHTYPSISLMVDANSSYTLNDIQMLRELDNYNLLMVEQPLDANDIDDSFLVDERGWIEVPQECGLGYHVNEEKLRYYTIDKFSERAFSNSFA